MERALTWDMMVLNQQLAKRKYHEPVRRYPRNRDRLFGRTDH
jgi:hypothetical protein